MEELLQAAQGLPEQLMRFLIHYARYFKEEGSKALDRKKFYTPEEARQMYINSETAAKNAIKARKSGEKFTAWMSDDFDEPLEEFAEYM